MNDANAEANPQLTINSRHLEDPAPAKKYAEEKFGRIGKFSLKLRTVQVMLQPEGGQFLCEAVLTQDHSPRIVVAVQAGDLNSAIDLAVDRAERLLVREKERVSERRHRPAGAAPEEN